MKMREIKSIPKSVKPPMKNWLIKGICVIIFVMIGIIICFAAVLMYVKSVSVKAVVTSVVETVTEDEDGIKTIYKVYASYTYKGEKYNDIHCLNFESGIPVQYSVGSEITVRIDPDEPSHTKAPALVSLILFLFGAVFSAIGLDPLVYGIRHIRLYFMQMDLADRLVNGGMRIDAQVTSVRTDNGKANLAYYVIYCRYINPVNGRVYKFESMDFLSEGRPKIPDGIIGVFVDWYDYTKYYVDISSVENLYL